MSAKNDGMDNSSTYVGMMPARKLGIMVLGKRGNQYPAETGRRILINLANTGALPSFGAAL